MKFSDMLGSEGGDNEDDEDYSDKDTAQRAGSDERTALDGPERAVIPAEALPDEAFSALFAEADAVYPEGGSALLAEADEVSAEGGSAVDEIATPPNAPLTSAEIMSTPVNDTLLPSRKPKRR